VKRWLAIALAVWSMPAFGGDWQAELHPLQPGKFPPPRPQTAKYRFGWGAVSAADAQIEFTRQKQDQLQLKLTAKTTGAVRALYQLDAEHTARCNAVTLRPIVLQQTERYRRETEKTKVEFSDQEVARVAESVPAPKTPPKTKRFKFSGVVDLQSALLLVRSQPLAVGDRYELVVYPSRAPFLARIEVLAKETLKVGEQSYPATKLQISLQGIDKKLALQPHKKFKNGRGWISDDKERLLLKVEAEVFVGSVWMELQSVKFLDEPAGQRTQMPR
jgi:hypothetical protein